MSRVTMIQHISIQISDKERTGFQCGPPIARPKMRWVSSWRGWRMP